MNTERLDKAKVLINRLQKVSEGYRGDERAALVLLLEWMVELEGGSPSDLSMANVDADHRVR